MNTTYGLARVSTIGQKNNTSLSFQSKRIKDYCRLHNHSLENIIIETESGAKSVEERSGLSHLQQLIGDGKCKTIIVNAIDRLGRNLLHGLLFLKFCEEHATRVISISQNIDTDDPSSSLIINILWSIAEHERDVIIIRLSEGREKKFLEGKKPYGSTPYGYRKDRKGKIVVDEDESKIVHYIFKRYHTLSKMKHLTKTKRTQKLLHSLRVKRFKFRGKDFQWWNIKQILSNSFYSGKMNWNGRTTKHNYDHIISTRMFNQIQSNLAPILSN